MRRRLVAFGLLVAVLLAARRALEPDPLVPPVERVRFGRLRRFNRGVVNPLVGLPVARRLAPLAVVRHVGRRSGRAYATPVLALPIPDGLVIPLTYGAGADWCRNVLTAGGCEVERKGRRQRLVAPRAVAAAEDLAGAPPPIALWRRLVWGDVLLLRDAAPSGASDNRTRAANASERSAP